MANKLFWQQNTTLPAVVIWRGFAFENVCFNHIEQIKTALGINGIISSESAWTKKADDEEGVQIDMHIIRKDNAVNMCEIKFYSDDFSIYQRFCLCKIFAQYFYAFSYILTIIFYYYKSIHMCR